MLTITIENYMTDGPGFCGDLVFNIDKNEIMHVNESLFHKFEKEVLGISSFSSVNKEDFNEYNNKYSDTLQYDLTYSQFKKRAVALVFENGTAGLFLVGGDSVIVNIINFYTDDINTISFN